ADTRFHPLPAEPKAKKDPKQLTLRVVSYDGATNGELTVEIKNSSKSAAEFTAAGLYFVPGGPADEAPQRLGAVGPFVVDEQPEERRTSMTVAPGQTVRLTLDVFCID